MELLKGMLHSMPILEVRKRMGDGALYIVTVATEYNKDTYRYIDIESAYAHVSKINYIYKYIIILMINTITGDITLLDFSSYHE